MEKALYKPQTAAFAEIIASSLHTFSACCWKWNITPEFGSLVKVKQNDKTMYAIVYNIKTTSLDPMRDIHVYQKTEEEMYQEYPHLFDFLKTTFEALVIGYLEHSQYYYARLKTPIKLYSFTEYATEEELQLFFSDPQSMNLLLHPGILIEQYEDLLCSVIKIQKKLNVLSHDRLATVMSQYALSTNASYRHLKTFFDRIS